jgi:hypothetical protein
MGTKEEEGLSAAERQQLLRHVADKDWGLGALFVKRFPRWAKFFTAQPALLLERFALKAEEDGTWVSHIKWFDVEHRALMVVFGRGINPFEAVVSLYKNYCAGKAMVDRPYKPPNLR